MPDMPSPADAFALSVQTRANALQANDRETFGDPALMMACRLTATDFVYANAHISYDPAKPKPISATTIVAVELVSLAISLLRGAKTGEVLAVAMKTIDTATRYAGALDLDASPAAPPTVAQKLPQTYNAPQGEPDAAGGEAHASAE